MKFGEVWGSYFDFKDDGSRYWRDIRGVYRREIPEDLASKAAALVTRADLRHVLDTTRQKSPNLERWLYEPLNVMFKWAIERELVPANPAAGLTPPAPPIRRDRVLTQAELVLVLKAVDGMGYPSRQFYMVLILTACRRDEAAGMRWDEVDLGQALWRIPKERTKDKREHALELPQMAVELLRGLPRSPSCYVLTTNNRSPISGYSKAKAALDARLAELGDVAPFRFTISDARRQLTWQSTCRSTRE